MAAHARGGRWSGRAVVVLVLTVLASAMSLVEAAPAVGSGITTATLSSFGDIVVHDATGRVFVSGDDEVIAFDAAGTQVGVVNDVFGARGLAFAGGFLWAAETSAAAIAKIDPSTLAKVGEYPAGGTIGRKLAAVGGAVFFVVEDTTHKLRSLNPLDGAITARGDVSSSGVVAIPGAADRLLVGDSGSSPFQAALYDVSANPAVSLGAVPFGHAGSLFDVAASDAGTFVTATGAPYEFPEYSLTPEGGFLHRTGVEYPGSPYPNGVAYSPGAGGVFAGTLNSDDQISIARRGVPSATHLIDLPADPLPAAVALTADASTVYAVLRGTAPGQVRLFSQSLAPTLDGLTVTTLAAGQIVRSIVTGTGLGSIASITLGGHPVQFAHDGPGRLVLDVSTSLPPGPATLEFVGPFGNLSAPVTVLGATTGTVAGTVTDGGLPARGVQVRLDGPDGVRTTTSAVDGTWSLAGVAAGPHQDLTVTDGDRTVHLWDRTLGEPAPWTLDVDLLDPPPASAEVRRYALPPGAVRRTVSDPASGDVFVAVGDEVVVFDSRGRLLGRVHDQWTASDLQVVGTKLYVMLHHAGRVSRIDIPTLAVDRTFKLRRANTGSLAVTGNRIHFTDGDDQWTSIASFDLTTGAVKDEVATQYTPEYAPVQGAPQSFISFEVGLSSSRVVNWNAASGTIEHVGEAPFSTFGTDPSDFAASSSAQRAWNAWGTELDLATMQPTGVSYPFGHAGGAVAWSAGHGGVVALGDVAMRKGTPKASTQLAGIPARRSLALDAAGDHAYTATEAGEFVVTDLGPAISALGPAPEVGQPGVVTIAGVGLGSVTKVSVDGGPVSFAKIDPTELTMNVPGLAAGLHEVTVTTPWGTSSPIGLQVGPVLGDRASAPFASWVRFVKRQYADLTTVVPSDVDLHSWVAALGEGSATKGDLVAALRRGADNTTNVDPTARLYRAFLGRAPDASGLRFWIGRRRSGSWTLVRMADTFASSHEFTAKYGALTNRQFVTRIYTDVLGRAADPSGVEYWTASLNAKKRTRGQVMVGFSESSEYKRKQAENTDVAVAYVLLMGRGASAAETSDWVTREKAGTSMAVLATELLGSDGYRTHITG